MIKVFCCVCDYACVTNHCESFVCPSCGSVTKSSDFSRVRYRHLTDAQKKAICNGCGGKGGYVVPPYASVFKNECDQHDFNYFLGYRWYHRCKADYQLFKAMLTKIWGNGFLYYDKLRHHKKMYYSLWAFLYYISVSLVGWKFFNYGSAEQELPNVN